MTQNHTQSKLYPCMFLDSSLELNSLSGWLLWQSLPPLLAIPPHPRVRETQRACFWNQALPLETAFQTLVRSRKQPIVVAQLKSEEYLPIVSVSWEGLLTLVKLIWKMIRRSRAGSLENKNASRALSVLGKPGLLPLLLLHLSIFFCSRNNALSPFQTVL